MADVLDRQPKPAPELDSAAVLAEARDVVTRFASYLDSLKGRPVDPKLFFRGGRVGDFNAWKADSTSERPLSRLEGGLWNPRRPAPGLERARSGFERPLSRVEIIHRDREEPPSTTGPRGPRGDLHTDLEGSGKLAKLATYTRSRRELVHLRGPGQNRVRGAGGGVLGAHRVQDCKYAPSPFLVATGPTVHRFLER